RRYSVWYRFGSGCLPEPAGSAAGGDLVLARRELTEGTLVIVTAGDGKHVARLEPRDASDGGDARGGRGWWRRMFAARAFTVAARLGADEGRVVPGPWAWRGRRRARRPRRASPDGHLEAAAPHHPAPAIPERAPPVERPP